LTRDDLLTLLQADLNLLMLDETRLAQLNHLLDSAVQFITREGVVLTSPYSVEDGQLIIMYAAYLFRKRATDEGMPRMLRWALNNRIFGKKAGTENAT
jgi:hypothetical protein